MIEAGTFPPGRRLLYLPIIAFSREKGKMARRERRLRDVWAERDAIGVQDCVMLDNYTDETALYTNLRDRFMHKLIYVRIIPPV